MLNHASWETSKKYKDKTDKPSLGDKPTFDKMSADKMRNYYNEW